MYSKKYYISNDTITKIIRILISQIFYFYSWNNFDLKIKINIRISTFINILAIDFAYAYTFSCLFSHSILLKML